MNITIVPIPTDSRRLLAQAQGWRETRVPPRMRIARHFHDFQAFYYAFNIHEVEADGVYLSLPEAAIVVVPTGVVHSWRGQPSDGDGMVGHFHEDHGYHFIENASEGLVLNS